MVARTRLTVTLYVHCLPCFSGLRLSSSVAADLLKRERNFALIASFVWSPRPFPRNHTLITGRSSTVNEPVSVMNVNTRQNVKHTRFYRCKTRPFWYTRERKIPRITVKTSHGVSPYIFCSRFLSALLATPHINHRQVPPPPSPLCVSHEESFIIKHSILTYSHRCILRVQPTRCDVSQFIYFCKTLCMFQTLFLFIIRSSKLHIWVQRQEFVRLPAGNSNGLTNALRCMCSFELLIMDGKPSETCTASYR
jgi:hypothetical protein